MFVANYLEQLESGSKNLNEARIIILGEKGAGKTCLARRLINPEANMTKKEESTAGVDTTMWKIGEGNNSVNVHIWDFAGHVITHAAHRCFLSERCVYIIVYNGRTETENRLTYWLDHVKTYGGDAPVRVLINIFDENIPDIPENTLKDKYTFIRDFVYFSIGKEHKKLELNEDKIKLNKFRDETIKLILHNPLWNRLKIPASYYKVKSILETYFQEDGKDHIDKADFEKIIDNYIINNKNEEQINLLKDLHSLGVCLWYEKLKIFNMLVLNPDWITNGIYRAINWTHNKSKNTISVKDYENIFAENKKEKYPDEKERYPADKFRFLINLMQEYELAYSKGKDIITIPHLLKSDRPINIPNFNDDSLMIKYISEAPLPPNTVCRLIVRHHEEIKK